MRSVLDGSCWCLLVLCRGHWCFLVGFGVGECWNLIGNVGGFYGGC